LPCASPAIKRGKNQRNNLALTLSCIVCACILNMESIRGQPPGAMGMEKVTVDKAYFDALLRK